MKAFEDTLDLKRKFFFRRGKIQVCIECRRYYNGIWLKTNKNDNKNSLSGLYCLQQNDCTFSLSFLMAQLAWFMSAIFFCWIISHSTISDKIKHCCAVLDEFAPPTLTFLSHVLCTRETPPPFCWNKIRPNVGLTSAKSYVWDVLFKDYVNKKMRLRLYDKSYLHDIFLKFQWNVALTFCAISTHITFTCERIAITKMNYFF